MKNIMNFRLIFFCFIAYLFAILFGSQFLSFSTISIIFFSVTVISLTTISILRNKIWQFCAILLFFIFGFVSFYADFSKFQNIKTFDGPQIITGRVVGVTNYSSSQSVVLNNVVISQNKERNISVYIVNGTFEIGDEITFQAMLENASLFELGSFQSHIYTNNIHHTAKTDAESITSLTKTPLTTRESIKKSINELFHKYMPGDIAELSYSALFGDRGDLDSEINNTFSVSGISHILSVSGMHVAFLVLLVDTILKKCKVSSKARFAIFVVILFFYSYLCSFGLTVVRASIMSLVLLTANLIGKQYDSLNSIGIAGLFILLLNPLSAFSVGFQLSFLCVLIIALFSNKLTKLLIKVKIPKSIASVLSITTCVQLGLLPMMAKYFGSVSLLSVFTNLLCIPIFEIAFICTILFILPAMIFPFLGFLLTFNSFLYQIVVIIADFIANQTWAIIPLFGSSDYALILFYVALFVASGFIMITKKQKSIVFLVLLSFSIIFSCFAAVPKQYQDLTIMEINNYSTETILISESGESILISDLTNTSYTKQFLNKAKMNQIDIVVFLGQSLSDDQTAFLQTIKTNDILYVSQSKAFNAISVSSVQLGYQKYVLLLQVDGHNILYFNKQLSDFEQDVLDDYLFDKDVNITIHASLGHYDFDADYEMNPSELKTNKRTYHKLNNWLFTLKNGKLDEIRSLN